MRCAAFLVGVLFLAGRSAADDAEDLTAALVSGTWVKKLSGDSKVPDRYVYTFAKDGTYKSVLISDFTPAPKTAGKWQLAPDKDGKLHLRLKNEDGKYPWLAEDSVVRYDPKKDALLVSGLKYAGEVPLRHEKGN